MPVIQSPARGKEKAKERNKGCGQRRGKMQRIISAAILFAMIGFPLFQVGCTLTIGDHAAPVYAPPPESGPPPWAPAHGYRAKHHYYYYPESQVYFDAGRSMYFYYYGTGWQASVALPSTIHISAGNYVSLDMDADRPYLYHSDVEKKYPPGQLKKIGKAKNKKWD
jgi:hypothetical protein